MGVSQPHYLILDPIVSQRTNLVPTFPSAQMIGPRNIGDDPSPQPPRHQHPTRLLIRKYEALACPPTSDLDVPTNSAFNDFKLQKKQKSPIRQSFRNILSVFKKVNRRRAKQDVERPLSNFKKQHQPVLDNHPGLDAPPVLRSRSRKLTSSLLYLSRSPALLQDSPDLEPVWTSCSATLEQDSIVITSRTPYGNPSIHSIELSNCTDVRSLSLLNLDPEESALLPRKGDNDEFKVFEILFEGRPREKFAANSVQERAGWVSAIWDSVLPTQDDHCDQMADTYKNPQPLGNSFDDSVPLPSSAIKLASFSQRALPPLPMDSDLPVLPMIATNASRTGSRTSFCPPLSPSIYPSSQPVSRVSSGIDSRPASPSIANLSKLSVVRQRLAQMEATSSMSSGGGLCSPTSSRSSVNTCLTTPVFRSEREPAFPQAMARNQSGRSSAADSILNSYIEPFKPEPVNLAPLPFLPELEERGTQISPRQCRPKKRRIVASSDSESLRSLIDLLHDHSTKSSNQATTLGNQVLSVQNEIQRLPISIASAVNIDGDTNTVLKMVAKIEAQSKTNGEILGSLESKMHKLALNRDNTEEYSKLVQGIQSLRADVMEDLKHIRTSLGSRQDNAGLQVEMKNVVPREADLTGLQSKVDVLLSAIANERVPSVAGVNQVEETLAKIVSLVEKDNERQTIQAQQQSETVRYLTELNSWLEALVSHDSLQKHSLVAGIDQLHCDLNYAEGGSTLIEDIRQLVQCAAARDHNIAVLQSSLDGLCTTLNESSVESGVARIGALINQQRQYQEGLVRALGAEISDEIKGERLRFVEAMKEATAINVQIHVEQFKNELKREVVEMTEEVGRLHQDRQAMQGQIADLFAFYAKQRAAAEQDLTHVASSSRNQGQAERAGRRQLPIPGR